jgi:hypothetical protein
MLEQLLEVEIEVRDKYLHNGRERIECSLASEDGQTLHLYEGQLKDLGKKPPLLEKGKRYKLWFRPFVNNQWIEVKIVKLEPVTS